ncbi:DUF4926 domain-containing protein [Nocardia sp. NPDC052566]|uniref:DUF4926 domain-containing protein n=1 Tax=Nocardia sp. NPDC052566 TaxID=3364330 RepID=UPI0037CA87DB
MINNYDKVRVVTDRFTAEGAAIGSVGYVIEKHSEDAYEVEVSDPSTGETIASFVARRTDLQKFS